MLFRDRDVEEGLLKIIISWNPNSVVTAAANLLKVFSTAVSPIPKSVSDSKLHHALLATAICLQGRFREMTTLQYLMGFVMLHGNCTQRVRP